MAAQILRPNSHRGPNRGQEGVLWSVRKTTPGISVCRPADARRAEGLGSGSANSLPAGVTLMEVLISIFILAIGLLGVAALLPVGGSEIAAGVQADRAAAVAAAAMREIRLRNILQPVQLDMSTNPPRSVLMWFGSLSSIWDPTAIPYIMIDPVGVTAAGASTFPVSGTPTMPRFNLGAAPKAIAGPLTLPDGTKVWLSSPLTSAGARELFVSKDDVLFDIPSDRRQRAKLIYRQTSTGAISSDPGAYNPANCRPEFDGNYSWMVMVGPPLRINTASSVGQGWCSVIVFYKRNLNLAESEIVVPVTSAAMTEVGGEIVVTLSDPNQAALLERDRWILLCTTTSGTGLFQWHRIVASARPNPASNQWYVTVVGDAQMGPPIPNPQKAILVQGVIGVFSRLVEIELEQKY